MTKTTAWMKESISVATRRDPTPARTSSSSTPSGVGMGRTPPRFLQDGDVLTTEIAGLGRLENTIRIYPSDDAAAPRTVVATTTTKE